MILLENRTAVPYSGFENDFREGSKQTIETAFADTFCACCFQQGSGKSLCYQFTATTTAKFNTGNFATHRFKCNDQLDFLRSKGIAGKQGLTRAQSKEEAQAVMTGVQWTIKDPNEFR